jgi:hypothetical protein
MSIKRDPVGILGADALHELWGEGYTVVPRSRHADPTHIDPAVIPRDRAYQWVSREHDLAYYKTLNWHEVPAERHPGVFAPWGYSGNCTFGDLILVDKPRDEAEKSQKAGHDKAHQNVVDWGLKVGAAGFTGHTVVADGGNLTMTEVGETPHRLHETQTEIPPELIWRLKAILKERDQLVAEEHKAHLKRQETVAATETAATVGEEVFDLLACRVRCMQQAISNIRTKLASDKQHQQEQHE